ncbi:MAG: hypothetical protein JNM27_16610 [Leptospirales bacterium]|nr:hypothetical protein [Leptospirales bacterium]
MRIAITALLTMALFVGCKSGDEGPTDVSPLVSLLNLNYVEAYAWNGALTSRECSADNVVNQVISCETYQALEQDTVATVPNNATIIFQHTANNVLHANMTLVIPNYNLLPTNLYQVTANVVTEQGYDTGSGNVNTMRLGSQLSSLSSNTTRAELIDFSATNDPANLPGTLKLRLSDSAQPNAGSLVVTYGFNLVKMY